MIRSLKVCAWVVVLHAVTVMVLTDRPNEQDELLLKEWARQLCNATKEEIQRSNSKDARIVGGGPNNEIIPEDYFVILSLRLSAFHNRMCGGAIINTHYILTAGSCVREHLGSMTYTLKDIAIYAGGYPDSGTGYVQTRKPSQIILHPKHKSFEPLSDYDIAIIKVDEPFNFNYVEVVPRKPKKRYVGPIQLPKKETPLDTKAWIIGGGCNQSQECSKTREPWVTVATVPLWSKENCTTAWTTAHNGSRINNNFLYGQILCAGGKRVGSCVGDNGGPLVILDKEQKPVIIGITSILYEYMCGCEGVPAVYTKVLSYLDWIQKNTQINASGRHLPISAVVLCVTSLLTYFNQGFFSSRIN